MASGMPCPAPSPWLALACSPPRTLAAGGTRRSAHRASGIVTSSLPAASLAVAACAGGAFVGAVVAAAQRGQCGARGFQQPRRRRRNRACGFATCRRDDVELAGGDATSVAPLPLKVRDADRAASEASEILSFERNGFLRCPGLLSASEAQTVALAIEEARRVPGVELAATRHQVRVHCGKEAAADEEGCRRLYQSLELDGEVSFLQYFNLHRLSDEARTAALSPRFGFWAARLLGVPAVRLYQDALFVKRPGHGPTQWHSDLGLAPFDTNHFITAWVALTPVPDAAAGGSGLSFARGSHRDFAFPYFNDIRDPSMDLEGRYEVEDASAFELGDATFHHGWTLHSAAPAPDADTGTAACREQPRVAWALSFVADGARTLPRVTEQDEDFESFGPWLREVGCGVPARHPLLPLVPLV